MKLNRPNPKLVSDSGVLAKLESLRSHDQIDGVLNALYFRDPATYNHCHRVGDLTQWLGFNMGLGPTECTELYLCGLLHDVGKMKTPASVLQKAGPLTPDEFKVMKTHALDSAELVSSIRDIAYLKDAILSHHERLDGKGYPHELPAKAVPIYSRIVLIADTFDAMTSDRPYRKGLAREIAYEELLKFSGTQFDPDAASIFVNAHDAFMSVRRAKAA